MGGSETPPQGTEGAGPGSLPPERIVHLPGGPLGELHRRGFCGGDAPVLAGS